MNYIHSAPAALLNFKNCSFDTYRIWIRDPWFKLTQHSKNWEWSKWKLDIQKTHLKEPYLYPTFLNLVVFYKRLVAGIMRFYLLYFRILATKQARIFVPENASLFCCKWKFQSLPVWNHKRSDNHCPCEHRAVQTFYQIKFFWFNLNFEYKCNSGPICKNQLQIQVKTCLWYWILIHYFSFHVSQITNSRNKIINYYIPLTKWLRQIL